MEWPVQASSGGTRFHHNAAKTMRVWKMYKAQSTTDKKLQGKKGKTGQGLNQLLISRTRGHQVTEWCRTTSERAEMEIISWIKNKWLPSWKYRVRVKAKLNWCRHWPWQSASNSWLQACQGLGNKWGGCERKGGEESETKQRRSFLNVLSTSLDWCWRGGC